MTVWNIVWGVYGLIFGVLIALFILFRLHPWRWAWLQNKIKRKAHMVAVLVDEGIPGIPMVVEMGKPIKFFNDERLWVFNGRNIIEMTPDGKTVKQKIDITDKIYKINGIPTVFFSLKDMRPLKLEGHGKEIPPEEVGPLVERYISIRLAQAFISLKHMDLKTWLILIGVGLSLIASLYALWNTFQILSQLHEIHSMLKAVTSPGIHPAPTGVETNTVVIGK